MVVSAVGKVVGAAGHGRHGRGDEVEATGLGQCELRDDKLCGGDCSQDCSSMATAATTTSRGAT